MRRTLEGERGIVDRTRHTQTRHIARILAAVAFVAAASCGRSGCSCDRVENVEPYVPEDASGAILFSPPGALRPPIAAFLAGVAGEGGLFDWMDGKYGVDISSEDGLRASGIEPGLGIALVRRDGVSLLLGGASDQDAFTRLVYARLSALGYPAPTEHEAGGMKVLSVLGDAEAGRPHVAFGWKDNLAILATGAEDEAVLIEAVRAVAARDGSSGGFTTTDGWRSMAEALPTQGPGALAYYDLHALQGDDRPLVGMLRGLGPMVGGALEKGLASARDLGFRFTVVDDRIALDGLLRAEEGAIPTDWITVEGPPPPFGAMLPRETTMLLRLRANVLMIRDLPAFIREMILPAGILGRIHPLLKAADPDQDLLAHMTGHVAVAFIGLGEASVLGKLVVARKLSQVTSQIQAALLFEVHDARAFLAAWSDYGENAAKAGFELTETPGIAGGPPVMRFSQPKTGEDYAVLVSGNVVALLIGSEAYVEVRDVLEGRATPLRERAESPLAKAVVGAVGSEAEAAKITAGVFLTFNRLTRQLGEKGAPPFYLRVINSIFEATAALEVTPSSVRLSLEAVQ